MLRLRKVIERQENEEVEYETKVSYSDDKEASRVKKWKTG